MFRLLLPVCAVLALFVYWKAFARATPEQRSQRAQGLGLLLAVVVLAAVAVRSGSWVWVAGAFFAVILLRAIPYISAFVERTLRQPVSGSGSTGGTRPSTLRGSKMTREEALRILDLVEPVSARDLQTRYRELMRGVHPDRGGSNHLAAQVNEAYRVLLGDPPIG